MKTNKILFPLVSLLSILWISGCLTHKKTPPSAARDSNAPQKAALVAVVVPPPSPVTTTNTVLLGWSAVSSATNYAFYYGYDAPGQTTNKILVGNTNAYNMTNVVPGRLYYFAVSGISATGEESPKSEEIEFVSPEYFTIAKEGGSNQAVVKFFTRATNAYVLQASRSPEGSSTNWTDVSKINVGSSNTIARFTFALSPTNTFYRFKKL